MPATLLNQQNSHGRKAPRKAPRKAHRGTTTVEMAIALPILILLVFGLFEFTRIYMIQQLMQNVAREGCRNAVIQGSINAKVLDEITQTLDRYGIRGATANLYVNNSNTDISNAVTNDQVSVQILVSSPAISIVPNGFFYAQLSAKATRRKH